MQFQDSRADATMCRAKQTFNHHMGQLARAAGVKADSDFYAELEAVLDEVFEAAVTEAEARALKWVRQKGDRP